MRKKSSAASSLTRSTKPAWLSAGIVPIFQSDTNLFLLLRVYNYWDFPKGLVEKGEAPLVAAQRELTEETGLTQVEFPWGQDYVETEPYRGGKIARYYVGKTFSQDVQFGINPNLGRAEHHEYRWVTKSEAEKLLAPRVANILEWASQKISPDKS